MQKRSAFIIAAKSLSILLIGYFSVVSFSLVAKSYFNESAFDFILFVVIWVTGLAGLIALSLIKNSLSKTLIVVVLGLCGLLVDLNYKILGDTITIESITFLWSEKSYFSDAFVMYGKYAVFPVLRFILYCIISFFPIMGLNVGLSMRKAGAVLLISMLIIFQIALRIDGRGVDGMPAQIAPLPFFVSMLKVTFEYKVKPRKEVEIPISDVGKIDNIVVIVDESIRGDFIDINYVRKTTPYLLSIKNRIINYGIAMSSYNRSSGSNAILRMGIGPEEFKSPDGRNLFTNPLIWQYARKAGYQGIFLNSQNDKFDDYMDEKEAAKIDLINWIKSSDGKESPDHAAARRLRELIKTPGKKFIYLVKKGAHFQYERTYPKNQRIFTPVMDEGASTTDRQKLVNSYRNSIRWTVNEFFKILLTDLSLKNTVIIYTSDHAQNLFDDKYKDTMLLHGRSKNSIPQETIVPMMIFTQNEAMMKAFKEAVPVNFNKCTHFQIFPTVLYLMGYQKDEVIKKYYQTLLDPVTGPVGYSEGNVRFGKHILKKVDPDYTKYIDPELMKYTK